MNHEPVDIRMNRTSTPGAVSRRGHEPTNTSVLDEAFASVSDADLRRDASHQSSCGKAEAFDLSSLLKQQQQALEANGRELAALLSRLEG